MSCTPGGSTTPILGLCKPAIGETGWGAAINANFDTIDALGGTTGLPRSYLAGCGLTRSSSTLTRVTVAAGQCKDANNTKDLTLTTNITKDLASAWAAGNNNGGLFSGTATQNTWYHVFLIGDISVTPNIIDGGFDTSVSAANKPAAYSAYRRLGSVRTATNNTNIVGFRQTGDLFLFDSATLDVNVTAPGTTATLRTLMVPIDVPVEALLNVWMQNSTAVDGGTYFSDPNVNNDAPSSTAAPLSSIFAHTSANTCANQIRVKTNTSAQVRTRVQTSDAGTTLRVATYGWVDRRGRDD